MIRWLGFVMIVGGASAAGILMATGVKRSLILYQQSIAALVYMKNEIEFQLTPIDKIAFELGNRLDAPLSSVFRALYSAIHFVPGIPLGLQMQHALAQTTQSFPLELKRTLTSLFDLLGKQDMLAQIRAINLAEERLNQEIQRLNAEKKERTRAYRTIGMCAGLALAVILI